MPVRLIRDGGDGARVPLVGDPFRVGRDETAGLRLRHPQVARRHARLRYRKGQWLVSPADDAVVYVGKARVPVLPLQNGDVIGFGEDAPDDPSRQVRFEDRLAGGFVPEGRSWTEAWLNHPASLQPEHGPTAYGEGEGLGRRGAERCWRVAREGTSDLVLKRVRALQDAADGDRFRRVLVGLSGAPHPALAPVVDGGVIRERGQAIAWMASTYVPGQTATDLVSVGGIDAVEVIEALRSLSAGLVHLHARGLIHRDISPGNVLLRPDGSGALIDFDRTEVQGHVAPSAGVVGTPGYVAPEAITGQGELGPAVDVYGLCAVGYALLCGRAPAEGDDVLDVLGAALRSPPRPGELGLEVPPALEGLLLDGLSPDPAARPRAEDIRRQVAFAEAQLGLGSEA